MAAVWRSVPILLALLLLRGIAENRAEEEDFLDKCCQLGNSWAVQKLRCEKFIGPVPGIPQDKETDCLEKVDVCCKKTFQDLDCKQGKSDAKSGLECARMETGARRTAVTSSNFRRDCCEGCKLGIITGSSGKGCSKKLILGVLWNTAFAECCNEAKTSVAPTTTTKVSTTISTSTVSTKSDSEELNEIFKDITDPDIAESDDLCQLMKGLLCSEICVSTPGSYYCKCYEGSVLQADKRTCKSNVVKTEKPKTTTRVPKTTTKPPKTTKATTTPVPKSTTKTPKTAKTTTTPVPKTTTKPPKTTKTATTPVPKTTTKPPKTVRMSKTTVAEKVTTTKVKKSTTGVPKKATTTAPKKTTIAKREKTTDAQKKKTTEYFPAAGAWKVPTIEAKLRTTRSASAEENELNPACPPGYRISSTSDTCDDIDECNPAEEANSRPVCPTGTNCVNSNGSYACVDQQASDHCELGYRWDALFRLCVDIDECVENTHRCSPDSDVCRNLDGSYECEIKCEPGFIFNRDYAACLDINECIELIDTCPEPDTICVNTLGGYECRSLKDYQQGINESEQVTNSSSERRPNEPQNTPEGGTEIVCANGLTYKSELNKCEDIDECEVMEQPCAQGEICRNTIGGYDCIPFSCPRGFIQVNDLCQDVDECEQNLHSCAPYERCQNTNGSFTCEPPRSTRRPSTSERPQTVCRKGYKPDYAMDNCIDIDECVEGPGCRDHERCINLQGSYDCLPLCGHGWYFHFQTKTCQDVDECLLGRHDCRQRTHYCRNTNGSYVCDPLEACGPGFRRSQDGRCVDIDECQESLHTCSRESYRYCVNREGSYECITRLPSCSQGFEYSLLKQECQDIDECRNGHANCDTTINERCINLPGSFRCERVVPEIRQTRQKPACPTGYRYDPALRMCSDIDECAEGNHNCGTQKCYNLPGSFQCAQLPVPATKKRPTLGTTRGPTGGKCKPGSRFNARRGSCIDIDECAVLEDACSSNEDCINSPGSFECICKKGFRRDEMTQACVDINECQLENDCQSFQRCDNTIGSYNCVRFLSCGTGYTLNAATEICEDDNECLLGTHDCAPGWRCRNTLGSYRCDRDRGPRTTTTPRSTLRWTSRATFRNISANYNTKPMMSTASTITMNTTMMTTTMTTTTAKPTTIATPRVFNTTGVPTTEKVITITEPIPTVASLPTTTPRPKQIFAVRPRALCPRGYESGPQGECLDIDECHRNLRMCGNLKCINTEGSFRCEPQVLCAIGSVRDPVTGRCNDIDECALGTHKCGPDQKCKNKPAGYYCVCSMGYEVSGNRCIDVDECARYPGRTCGSNSRCENSPGSYRCICEAGFENDVVNGGCIDVDECRTRVGLCEQDCYNTWGSHKCACRYGYRLRSDNRTCEDIDECTEFKENNLCVGVCENTLGSYVCKCPNGYRLAEDGRTCQDIDECAAGNACREPEEICLNVRGGFRCNKIDCSFGYILHPQLKNRCNRESPFCPADDLACFHRPAHYTYNYIAIVSMFPIPRSGQVELFTMRGAYKLPGSTVRFNMAFINTRAPPHVKLATESCFAVRRPFPSQAVLVMTQSLQGPQDIELELSMEIYDPLGKFSGSAVAKIFIIVTQYEF